MQVQSLPRLLYAGDVPVEATVAGSALIFRLLQNYPTPQLQIVEGSIWSSIPERRLPGVVYQTINSGNRRYLHSRFSSIYGTYLLLLKRKLPPQLLQIVGAFQPEAILTVAHGIFWLSAVAVAQKCNLPLHLIVHDDWPNYVHVTNTLRPLAHNIFKHAYRRATSRLCVSPYMAECYQERYGVAGTVLYPSRAADTEVMSKDINAFHQRKKGNESTTFAYAGSINTRAYARSLVDLAQVLGKLNATLIIYTALSPEQIDRVGFNKSNVTIHPLIPYQELINALREQADVLFLPMSFESGHKANMELGFPSKFADYTAIGLPILICGPAYASAVRWAEENPGVAEVVTDNSQTALTKAVEKLNDPAYRYNLGNRALQTGNEYFTHSKVTQRFFELISQVTLTSEIR